MAILKQSTAYSRMILLVQTSDHITGLTGASPTVTLSKAGAAFGALGGSIAEVSSGWYNITLNTTDTGTLGDLAYHITAASGDPTDFVDQVCVNILGDTLPANVTQINAVSTSSVTTVSANQGTTQPINFTGTAGSALAKSDMVDISGTPVNPSSAQLGVNLINVRGTLAQTDSNGYMSVNVQDWAANIVSATTAGIPDVNIKNINNAAVSTASAQIGVNVVTNGDKTAYTLTNAGYAAVMTQQLTESYAAKGTVPTPAQAILEMRALLAENGVASTTVTTKKIDGSTTAHTYTLDSGTAPTVITTAT